MPNDELTKDEKGLFTFISFLDVAMLAGHVSRSGLMVFKDLR